MKIGLFALAMTLLLALAPTGATAGADHERARRAFESGEIVSLSRILSRVQSAYRGKILEIELMERRRGDNNPPWVYTVKVLTPQGHVIDLELDAKTTRLLDVRGRGGRDAEIKDGYKRNEKRKQKDEKDDVD